MTVLKLEARVRELERALASAAESTITALDRIQLMHPVVEAARHLASTRRSYLACETGSTARSAARAIIALDGFVESYEQAIAGRH